MLTYHKHEDKALVRKFLNEILRIEPKRIRSSNEKDLESLFCDAVRLWKPEWSEHNVKVVANFLTGIFGIYAEEEKIL